MDLRRECCLVNRQCHCCRLYRRTSRENAFEVRPNGLVLLCILCRRCDVLAVQLVQHGCRDLWRRWKRKYQFDYLFNKRTYDWHWLDIESDAIFHFVPSNSEEEANKTLLKTLLVSSSFLFSFFFLFVTMRMKFV